MSYQVQQKMNSGERTVIMSIFDEEIDFMIGHVIDGISVLNMLHVHLI